MMTGMPPAEPGAQLAQLASLLAKNNVPDALFSLADAIVRIANGTANPRAVAESIRELLDVAIPAPAPVVTEPPTDTPPTDETPKP